MNNGSSCNHPHHTDRPHTDRPAVIHLEGGYEIGTCAQEFNSATKNFALWKTYTESIDGHEEEFSELIFKSRDFDNIVTEYAQQKAMDELDAGQLHSVVEISDRIDDIKEKLYSNCKNPRYGFLTQEDRWGPEDGLFVAPRPSLRTWAKKPMV